MNHHGSYISKLFLVLPWTSSFIPLPTLHTADAHDIWKMSESTHAIVFGASGLLGWATVEQLLSNYPSEGSFENVTAVMNRPLLESDSFWPPASPTRPRLQIASDVNLTGTLEDLTSQLKGKVDGIEGVTHVFYFVFNQGDGDDVAECKTNCSMMQTVVDAVTTLSPNLKAFVYSGGTRGYGIYTPGGTFKPPLEESMADNLPEDYAKTVAYPWWRQILAKASDGKPWTWSEVCPDAVVGFSPNGSGFSLALHWAQYLSLYAYNHGVSKNSKSNVEVSFPGNQAGYNSLCTPVSSRILGRIAIHASLHGDKCGTKVINMADREQPTKFSDLWPSIADWFGLVGVGPRENDNAEKPGEYVKKHRQIFEEQGCGRAVTAGVGGGSVQLDSVGYWLSFDRQLSLQRLRSVGFTEERNPVQGWLEAFEKFREASIIL
ncbi:uncharacterized protein CCOS01_03396 [Colletotrichum costaricense]|uniref:PRISE-like Rossmann-fold domain-containing protein n=1 Tax=Colletotrichum costaricense TaxID=1209916 RepID=A0AAI9Z532_9PEZI|nr:uncharacterized protein CCOS01_03396 [Colletotrichum costaricense]KAK1534644.1 hypothetical protein CCOS01_03396 [Colletotrichum costaricense]